MKIKVDFMKTIMNYKRSVLITSVSVFALALLELTTCSHAAYSGEYSWLTANNLYKNVNGVYVAEVGQNIEYQWSSASTNFNSWYTADAPDSCPDGITKNGEIKPWIAKSSSGKASVIAQECQAGRTYTITIEAMYNNQKISSSIKVKVINKNPKFSMSQRCTGNVFKNIEDANKCAELAEYQGTVLGYDIKCSAKKNYFPFIDPQTGQDYFCSAECTINGYSERFGATGLAGYKSDNGSSIGSGWDRILPTELAELEANKRCGSNNWNYDAASNAYNCKQPTEQAKPTSTKPTKQTEPINQTSSLISLRQMINSAEQLLNKLEIQINNLSSSSGTSTNNSSTAATSQILQSVKELNNKLDSIENNIFSPWSSQPRNASENNSGAGTNSGTNPNYNTGTTSSGSSTNYAPVNEDLYKQINSLCWKIFGDDWRECKKSGNTNTCSYPDRIAAFNCGMPSSSSIGYCIPGKSPKGCIPPLSSKDLLNRLNAIESSSSAQRTYSSSTIRVPSSGSSR